MTDDVDHLEIPASGQPARRSTPKQQAASWPVSALARKSPCRQTFKNVRPAKQHLPRFETERPQFTSISPHKIMFFFDDPDLAGQPRI
jgi:hypothetical protein